MINKRHLMFFCYLVLLSPIAKGTVLHWPECASGLLSVQNTTTETQRVYLQTFDPTLKSEVSYQIPKLQTIQIPVDKKNTTERNALLYFSNARNIKANLNCQNKNYGSTSLEGGIQTFKKSELAQQIIYLKNLFTEKNKFKIELLDRYRKPLRIVTKDLKSNEQRKIMLLNNSELFYIRVSAESKFASFNLTTLGSQNAMIADSDRVPEPSGVFFEVAPRDGIGDSFTVQIQNPDLIAKARQQISDPSLEKMLFAKIQKGHHQQNRNLASITKNFWNWAVLEVTNIADIGSTSCNGLPQMVDDRIDFWTTNPGRICFWTYRIKREVPALEIATGQKIN